MQKILKQILPIRITNYLRRFKWAFKSNSDRDFINKANDFLAVEPELNWLLSRLSIDAICLDIGANIGLFSHHLCLRSNKGQIIAFEPRPDLFKRLNHNLKNHKNLKSFNIAITDQITNLAITLDPSHGNSTVERLPSTKGLRRHNVEGIPLDHFIKKNKLDKIDFIKIDVEGHEAKVLEGAREIIRQYRPIILCESENRHLLPLNQSVEQLIAAFTVEHNYKCFYLLNNHLSNYEPHVVPHSKSENSNYIFNWFLVPQEKSFTN